jgi:hypothetical protein
MQFQHQPQTEAKTELSQLSVRTRKATKLQIKMILFCSKLELYFQFTTLIPLYVIPT